MPRTSRPRHYVEERGGAAWTWPPRTSTNSIFQHEALYFALQRRASLRYAMDHGVLASNHECHQLQNQNPRISQRTADILGRQQGECAWIDLQFRKQELAEEKERTKQLEAEARRAEAEAYAKSDKRIKHEKCVDEWPNEHRDWFPPSPEGWLALGIYEYVLFSTSAELAADRDADFREQCMNRQIALPRFRPRALLDASRVRATPAAASSAGPPATPSASPTTSSPSTRSPARPTSPTSSASSTRLHPRRRAGGTAQSIAAQPDSANGTDPDHPEDDPTGPPVPREPGPPGDPSSARPMRARG